MVEGAERIPQERDLVSVQSFTVGSAVLWESRCLDSCGYKCTYVYWILGSAMAWESCSACKLLFDKTDKSLAYIPGASLNDRE